MLLVEVDKLSLKCEKWKKDKTGSLSYFLINLKYLLSKNYVIAFAAIALSMGICLLLWLPFRIVSMQNMQGLE